MLVAIKEVGDATAEPELSRARAALGVAAETLSAVCCDRRASPEAVAEAHERVCAAFEKYGRLMLSRIAFGPPATP